MTVEPALHPTLRFKSWKVDSDTSLSAVLPPLHPVCGIYVLRFANGQAYVGKTTQLIGRFAAHSRHHPDIIGLDFCAVPPDELNQAERDMVARLQGQGAGLRNVDLVGLPIRGAALDFVVDPEIQTEWLEGVPSSPYFGLRGEQARMRQASAARHAELRTHPHFDLIVDLLATYVGECLPWPQELERRFWSVTSLPSTSRTKTYRRLAVVNINKVEALVVDEECGDDGEWRIGGFLNAACDTVIPRRLRDDTWSHRYATTGPVIALDAALFEDWFADDEVLKGLRRFALGLLRKGHGIQGRYHDYYLADDVFVRLDELLAEAEDQE